MSDDSDAASVAVTFRLNGSEQSLLLPSATRLIDLLRGRFGLMAAKEACGIGRCGSCLVLVNGRAVNACLVMAWQLAGADIVSPEGLDTLPEGQAVHAGLTREVAFQCGYCAPGFGVALTALLRREPEAQEPAIRAALAGNLCRCSGYLSILRGAEAARAELAALRAASMCPSNGPASATHSSEGGSPCLP